MVILFINGKSIFIINVLKRKFVFVARHFTIKNRAQISMSARRQGIGGSIHQHIQVQQRGQVPAKDFSGHQFCHPQYPQIRKHHQNLHEKIY